MNRVRYCKCTFPFKRSAKENIIASFSPVTRGFVTIVIEADKFLWLHASAPSRLTTAVPRYACLAAAAVWLVNWEIYSLYLSPLIKTCGTAAYAHKVVALSAEDVVISIIGIEGEAVGEALL